MLQNGSMRMPLPGAPLLKLLSMFIKSAVTTRHVIRFIYLYLIYVNVQLHMIQISLCIVVLVYILYAYIYVI